MYTQCTKIVSSEVWDFGTSRDFFGADFSAYSDYDMTLDELEEMISTPLSRKCSGGVCTHVLEKPPSPTTAEKWEDAKCNAKEGATDGAVNGK